MESAKSNKVSIFHIILVLCFLNLLATGYLIMKVRTGTSSIPSTQQRPLPPGLDSSEKRAELFESWKTAYNPKNYDELYALFDVAVRVQLTRDEMIKAIGGLHRLLGKIKSGYYGHYEARKGDRGTLFTLHYPVNTEKGNAVLRISVLQQGDGPYRFWRFHLGTD